MKWSGYLDFLAIQIEFGEGFQIYFEDFHRSRYSGHSSLFLNFSNQLQL